MPEFLSSEHIPVHFLSVSRLIFCTAVADTFKLTQRNDMPAKWLGPFWPALLVLNSPIRYQNKLLPSPFFSNFSCVAIELVYSSNLRCYTGKPLRNQDAVYTRILHPDIRWPHPQPDNTRLLSKRPERAATNTVLETSGPTQGPHFKIRAWQEPQEVACEGYLYESFRKTSGNVPSLLFSSVNSGLRRH